jgi:hypothetical protein
MTKPTTEHLADLAEMFERWPDMDPLPARDAANVLSLVAEVRRLRALIVRVRKYEPCGEAFEDGREICGWCGHSECKPDCPSGDIEREAGA